MAGQPPEPNFQSSGQDQGLTAGRPAWQASSSSYTAPGGAAPDAPPGYSSPTTYTPQDQSYPGNEPTYTSIGQGQAQAQAYQNYGGYRPPGYGAPQGQGGPVPPPQWQAPPPHATPRSKHPGEKGFVGSLFDFSFSSFVTPKIIKVLYGLFTVWTALIGISILVIGFRTGGLAGGLFVLIIVEPIFLLLTLGIYRVVLEAFMVIFRMYDEMKKIRENTESPSQS